MGRKLLEISYLGTRYCGWQVQPNGITVQEVLQNALEKLLKHRPDVTGCSRTDSGVHAKSFYCHFDTDNPIPNDGVVLGLNTLLPDDVSAISCIDVLTDFHARYNSTGKTYCYRFFCSKIRDPFLVGRALMIKNPIDLKKAERYCSLMIGKHNFAAFSSIHRTVEDTVRTVQNAKVIKTNIGFDFYVTADGFLYNMVRIMVGALLDYSAGKITDEDIFKAFETGDRKLLGATAPPVGLYLEKVYYGKDL